jgi:ribosome-associated protein
MPSLFIVPLEELDCDYVRSSGPGGQNVNKVNSKCVMRWAVGQSAALPPEVRQRFIERFATRFNAGGFLVLSSDRYRDQKRNFEDCLAKAQAMLDEVSRPPKKRHKTKPTFGSRVRRHRDKRAHSEKKAQRGKVDRD